MKHKWGVQKSVKNKIILLKAKSFTPIVVKRKKLEIPDMKFLIF